MRARIGSDLARWLTVTFAVFSLIAMAVSCVFVYGTTRATYLDTQSERLAQVEDYITYAIDTETDGVSGAADSSRWLRYSNSFDPAASRTEAYIAMDEAQQKLMELESRMAITADEQGASSPEYAQLAKRHRELAEEYDRLDAVYYWTSLNDMVGRVRETFDLASLSVYIADEGAHEVTYLMDSVDSSFRQGAAAHPPGDTVQRPASDYPALWEAFDGGREGESMGTSPDGSLYLAYLVHETPAGQTWVVEAAFPTVNFNASFLRQVAMTIGVTGALFVALLLGLFVLLRMQVTRPLQRLAQSMRDYAAEKSPAIAQDIRSQRWPRDEIGMLAENTASMVDEMSSHIDRISLLSTERERIRSELEIAGRIQVSALPEVKPPYAGRDDFDLSASMHPAKTVGGDFYDFFMVDEARIGIVIADVSDKGVPAALFMMRAKATIKQLLGEGLTPADAMTRANNELCEDNKEGMFVTVWLGVLDVRCGHIDFANGGHNPPLLIHRDGEIEQLKQRSGLVLGCFEGIVYKSFELNLEAGDMLLLYTDGVTDAMSSADERYGEARLEAIAAAARDATPEGLTEAISEDVRKFSEGADQADDITLLALRYEGSRA